MEEAHYVLRPSIGAYLAKVLRAHNCACSGLEAAESIFVKRFGQLRNAVRSNHYGFTPEMRKTYAEIQKLVPILHWGRLPIISKYLMINSELIPEENLTEFYDGFDMLEALLNDIYGKGESMEMNGDQTLGKELTFSVFAVDGDILIATGCNVLLMDGMFVIFQLMEPATQTVQARY